MGEMLLFCADPLRPGRVDPHYAAEVRAARDLGLTVAFIDHDAAAAGDPQSAVSRVPRGEAAAWYRGWMLPADRYAGLAHALADRSATLLTPPDAYRRAHELPGWYGAFRALTPASVWHPATPGEAPDTALLASVTAPMGAGPAMVKDYVKSRKHEWEEAAYVPQLADTERLAEVVGRLLALQGDFLTGGVVVRTFERFVDGGEMRVWWVDGAPALVTAHPDTPEDLPGGRDTPDTTGGPEPLLDAVAEAVAALGCRFVSTDIALREDGVWRVIEVGDGQVSDLPRGCDASPLLTALATAARRRTPG